MGQDTNRVVLVGRLTQDPEVRTIGNGTSLLDLGVAVNSQQKNGDQWEDYANFFNVTVWGEQGKTISKFCSKGDQVAVTGRLQQQRWEKDGSKQSKVVVVADPFGVQFLAKKKEAEQPVTQGAPF